MKTFATLTAFALLSSSPAIGQVRVTVPQNGRAPQGGADDGRLARSLAEEVRRLADDINTDLGRTREGRHASEDARELAQSIDEYRQSRREGADPIARRQAYSSLHADWRHLRDGFARPGASSPVIDRDLARIDALEDQLSQSLGLNREPADDHHHDQPANEPAGAPPTRRLARALVDRSEALVVVVNAELGREPRAARLVADVQRLAQEADDWHDSLGRNTPPEEAASTFGAVDAAALRVERVIESRTMSPAVTAAWAEYSAANDLMHRTLNIRPTHFVAVPGITVPVVRPIPPRVPPVVGLADALVQQTTEFLEVFRRNAQNVPEGRLILGDAERLVAAAGAFRENLGRRVNPDALAASYGDVDVLYQRLARRVGRIAKGRTGPNIQQVARIGATCQAIHQTLGLPGLVPVAGPY